MPVTPTAGSNVKINVGGTAVSFRSNGSIASIGNPKTGLRVKPRLADGYPFTALVRETATGYSEWIRTNARYRGPCRMTGRGHGWRLEFPNLRYGDGRRTSVSICLELTAAADALRIEPTIAAGTGSHEVLELIFFHGNVLALDSPRHERVAMPDWGEGHILHDPRHANPINHWVGPYFVDGAHAFAYTAENGHDLSYGWIAAYGRRAGLALALINPRMLTMEFKLTRCADGLGLSAAFFRLRTHAECFPFRERAPLKLGYLLLIPLAGDWHPAADVYRREYALTMPAPVPEFGTGSERAKRLDVNLHYGILGAHCQTAQPAFNLTFAEVVARARAFITRYGIDPGRVMVWLYGIGINGHDRTNPTQRPMLGTAGGHAGFVRMCRALKALGVGSHTEYTHPWAMQQNQPGYDPDMDTGKSHKMMGVVTHNALCLDYRKTQEFYRDEVFRPFKADGVTDLFLDQATLCLGMCQRAHHDHGTDTNGLLGAHARGTERMLAVIRETFGADTIISTESHNDLGARTIELGVNGDCYASRRGTHTTGFEGAPQINRYTWPNVMRMVNHGAASSLPLIAINGCNSMLSQVWDQTDDVRKYLVFKAAINQNGPGYPFGFRDTVGLHWRAKNLEARVFLQPGEGLTITYYARTAIRDAIRVDLSQYGGAGVWTVPVRLRAGEYGFSTKALAQGGVST